MCVAFFSLDHPDYALILCSNRDEFLSRPTEPAYFHCFGKELDGRPAHILSGIDVQAGGTWLGLSKTGKLALLTNINEPHNTFTSSRGHLVSSFLTSPSQSLEDEVQKFVHPDASYAGFNLLLLAITPASHRTPPFSFDAIYVTNHGAGGPITYRPLTEAQRHRGGLSNGVDGHGANDWPKVQHGVRALDALLDGLPPNTPDDQLTERLFDLLTWRSSQPPRDRSELRNTIQVEPMNVDDGYYGTRVSTVVLVKQSGEVVFTERELWKLTGQGRPILADPSEQRVFRFKIETTELSK